VQFVFDSGKDATNLGKHGLSLAAAAELSWEAALVWIDDRADYGEVRMVALAPIEDILFFVAFVDASRQGELLVYAEPFAARSVTMSKPLKNISLKMPTLEEDYLITAAAESDPDALPLTDEQMRAMVPMRVLRGRPKLANKKQLVSIRYSPEVIDYFRASGAGWQSRMDAVLKDYIEAHSTGEAKGA
jgi:uncharacterized protein (DUF4415 family)/uncharacterized DUF497 family protein